MEGGNMNTELVVLSLGKSSTEKKIKSEIKKISTYCTGLSDQNNVVLIIETCGDLTKEESVTISRIVNKELKDLDFPCAIIWSQKSKSSIDNSVKYPDPNWMVVARSYGLHPKSDDIPRRMFTAL